MLKKTILTRRELLKLLLAANGGIAMASFLPAKWLKPIVSTGVLPVHAQTSSNFTLRWVSDTPNLGTGGGTNAKFAYHDPLGQVNGDTYIKINIIGGSNGSGQIKDADGSDGDGFNGTFIINFAHSNHYIIWLYIGSRETNHLTRSITVV